MVDELGYLGNAINKAKELADVEEASIIQSAPPSSWKQLFSGLDIKFRGESIISELKKSLYSSQPRVMYLWK